MDTAAMDTALPPSPPSPTPKASFASRLFGYDLFISFALGGPPRGSQSYASDLARRLREHDLSVFFSEDEAPPGSPLSQTLRRALLRSRLLVVIVNRGTLEMPNWVRTEVETFRSECPGRPVIPICLDESFRDQPLSDAAQPWLQHQGSIWIDEQPASAARGLATDALVTRLLTAPRKLKANTLWRALVVAVGLGLAVLAGLAVWQAVVATKERDRTSALRDQALSRQLAAQSTASLVPDPALALLLAVESRAVAQTPAADSALLGAMSSLPIVRLQQFAAAFETVAMRPDSDALMWADTRGAVMQGHLDQPAFETLVPARQGINLYGTVKALAFSPDGRSWAYAGSSREIVVRSGAASISMPDGDKVGESTPSFVHGLAFSPDGNTLAAASTSRSVRLHEPATGTARLLFAAPVDMTSLAFHPRGRWLAAGGDRGLLQAIAVAQGEALPKFDSAAIGAVSALAFDAAGERLFAASRGGRLEVFDTRDGRLLAAQEVPEQGALERMAVSPDGRFIATGHGNGVVLLWSWRDGALSSTRQPLLRHAGSVRGLAFAADGRSLVSVGQDDRLFVTLPADRGRWQWLSGAAPISADVPPSARGVLSPDGRWRAWPGTSAPERSPFEIDLSGLAPMQRPRLTIVRAADHQPLVDGAELPAALGETIVAGPVFSTDGSRIAVQVGERLLFWDVQAGVPLESAVALPPGARLAGAARDGQGWIARAAEPAAGGYFFLPTDLDAWADVSCRLAGRQLTLEEWRRYVGAERAYSPRCAGQGQSQGQLEGKVEGQGQGQRAP